MTVDNYYKIKTMKKTLSEELLRFNSINLYTDKLFLEQALPELPPDPNSELPAENMTPPDGIPPAPATVPTDPNTIPPLPQEPPMGEVTPGDEIPDTMGDTTEEIDVTDLYNMTKSIKKDLEDKNTQGNSEVNSKIEGVFSKLNDLEQKLAQMDQIFNKIDGLSDKVERMKEPTPVEKLEMRSLDSYPFNQKPQEFFNIKQGEMRQSGKNEYVLTKQDVEDYSQNVIKNTFNPYQEDENRF